jgi:hypothetical protein
MIICFVILFSVTMGDTSSVALIWTIVPLVVLFSVITEGTSLVTLCWMIVHFLIILLVSVMMEGTRLVILFSVMREGALSVALILMIINPAWRPNRPAFESLDPEIISQFAHKIDKNICLPSLHFPVTSIGQPCGCHNNRPANSSFLPRLYASWLLLMGYNSLVMCSSASPLMTMNCA